MPSIIRELVKRGSDPAVYLNIDKHARYGAVAPVLDAIRKSGVEHVVVLSQRVESETAMQTFTKPLPSF